jgi:hypothetical protein
MTTPKRKRGNTVPSNYVFDCWTLRYPDGSYEKSHDQRMHEAGLVAMYGDRDQAERTQRNKLPEHKPEIIRIRFSGRVEIVPAPAVKVRKG